MNKIEKAVLCGLIVTIIASCACGFTAFSQQCDEIRGSVLRLHILANSDSAEDQALKLKVRDKILSESSTLFAASTSKQEAMESASENLAEIQAVAQQEVIEEGYSYKVEAKIVNMYFTTRTYGNVTLPAGYYDALRITIGEAKGHNWWCVLYPALCIPAAEGDTKISDVLNSSEEEIVEGYSQPQYQIKFKVVEIYENIVNYFEGDKN